MSASLPRLWDDLLWWIALVPWLIRHPSARRCPRCKLTWERGRDMERYQNGVCHDCFDVEE